ncbi:MAG: hypothetical protein A2X36_17055 [Elusimicrobia bacterium GWA2_69_24]|nr:MAG: hypothetical protein A2X36_17055 [Elusimicrobia bacterium GWA2_69_24]HBL16248.1 hypothetical protein [Elusimicrobiota bacterium]
MKKKEILAIGRELSRELPGFVLHEGLMVKLPVECLLRGIWFDASGFDADAFYAGAFFMPLCVPAQKVHFTFGRRIRPSDPAGWDPHPAQRFLQVRTALQEEALPLLSRIETLQGAVQELRSRPVENPRVAEAIAYSLARLGDVSGAIAGLDGLPPLLDLQCDWQREMRDRALALRIKLAEVPVSAVQQLLAWEAETSRALGLDRIRKPA